MWRKTLFVTVIGILGIAIGLTLARFTSEAPSHNSSARLDEPAIQSDSRATANSSSQSDAPVFTQNIQQLEQPSRQQTAQTETLSNEAKGNTAIQASKHDEHIVLTPRQQQLYNDLSQRIESAPYGGFTMGNLQSQMADMPNEYQAMLLAKVVDLVNSGKLDPRQFVEGSK